MPLQPKVVYGGIGGAVGIIVVWLLEAVLEMPVPAEVAAAISTVLGFAFGWMKREGGGKP